MSFLVIFIASLAIALLMLEEKRRKKRFSDRLNIYLDKSIKNKSYINQIGGIFVLFGDLLIRRIIPKRDIKPIEDLMLRAGYFHHNAVRIYVATKFGSILILFFVTLLFFLLNPEIFNAKSLVVALSMVFGVGVLIETNIESRATKRQLRISQYCPDMMDMLVICAESGLSIDDALERVSRKIEPVSSELKEELIQLVHELKVLPDRSKALKNLATRTKSEEIRIMATTLNQSMTYGSSLSKTLRIVADDTRQKRLLKMEEHAAKVPAKMSLPLIGLILFPTLFLIAAPAVISLVSALSGN